MPSEKLERDHPVVRQVKEMNCIGDLLDRDHQIDDLKASQKRVRPAMAYGNSGDYQP